MFIEWQLGIGGLYQANITVMEILWGDVKKGNSIWNGCVAGLSHPLSGSGLVFWMRPTILMVASLSGEEGDKLTPGLTIQCRPDSDTGWLHSFLMGLNFPIYTARGYILSMVLSSADTVQELQWVISQTSTAFLNHLIVYKTLADPVCFSSSWQLWKRPGQCPHLAYEDLKLRSILKLL